MVIFFENFCVVFYDSLPAMDCNLIRSDLAQGFTQGFGAIFAFPGLFFFCFLFLVHKLVSVFTALTFVSFTCCGG